MIRRSVPGDLAAAGEVFRRASLSNDGDRAGLLAHPEFLVLGPEGLAEGRTQVAEVHGTVVGIATWVEIDDAFDLEDLLSIRTGEAAGIDAALVVRIVEVVRARGAQRLDVTANPQGFYLAAGFKEAGVAETAFGPASRMTLEITMP